MALTSSVIVSPSAITLEKGKWYYGASVAVYPENASPKIRWHSNNSSVASVGAASGYIYAEGVGTARIFATANDGSEQRDCMLVTVYDTVKVTSITLNRSSISMQEGHSETVSATVSPTTASNKTLSWVSSNPSVATVSNGVITAKSAGTTIITASATDGSGVSAQCSVEVTENILVTSVKINTSSMTLNVGGSAYLSANVLPVNATNRNVEWVSRNTNVVTVNPETGLLVAQSEGSTNVCAKAKDGSGKMDCCKVTVVPNEVQSVKVVPNTCVLKVGGTKQLNTTVCPSRALDKSVYWCSKNKEIATVDAYSGVVTAVAPGTVAIRAYSVSNPAIYGECTVNVGQVTTINGKEVLVAGEDEDNLDPYESEEEVGLYVYANDTLITSAREESNGDITVCIGEIAPALCTDYLLDATRDSFYVATSHKDIEEFHEKTYHLSDFSLCPIDNIYDRISLNKFIEDMGYSSKYSEVSYSNGTRVVIIQGHDWYKATPVSNLSMADLVSLTVGFIPVVGDAKDLADGIFGVDLITGEELTAFDRVLCLGCTFAPVISGSIVQVGRKGFAKIDNVIKYVDDLPDAKKAVIMTDIWNVLRPVTRGLCIEAHFAENVYRAVDGWYYIGKEMNGFFPVIDFIQVSDNIDDTVAVSLKTLDPRLYVKSTGEYDYSRMRNVINKYISKLKDADMFVDDEIITNRRLSIVVPENCREIIDGLEGINKSHVDFVIIEL